jgi:molybdopterin-guanine dinucleotide biosynthesis protein A
MIQDKATLAWTSGDLLDHTLARLAAISPDVRILCGPSARYADRGRPVLTDVVPDAGAVAGLITALRALRPGEPAVALAVDLPLVPAELLAHLLALAPEFDAVVPVSPRGAEPFCAVYRDTCRPAVERALSAGRLKMTAFWSEVKVREVATAELARFGDPEALFLNVNTPEDYARARAAAGLAQP